MSARKVVKIDEEKCDGCGLCVPACAEGAIQIIDGKAKLVSDIYCDGLGACLGECPQDAISIEEREAAEFDEAAVQRHLSRLKQETAQPTSMLEAAPQTQEEEACCPASEQGTVHQHSSSHGKPAAQACPGSAIRRFTQPAAVGHPSSHPSEPSQLSHWPIQLMLVPPAAPFLKEADVLICADCVPFTVPDFHSRYLAGRAVLVGCPKLDDLNYYYEKFKAIFTDAAPRKLTILRMEVPCCGGIVQAAVQARNEVASDIPVEVHTIGIQGGVHCVSIPAGKAA